MAILKEDTTIEATSGAVAASAVATTIAPAKKARTTPTKAKLGASRGFTKTTGVSKNWKIAVPVIALLGAGVFLAGGHYLANYIIDNGKLTEQIGTKSENGKPGTGLLGDNEKLEEDKEDLKDQLEEAQKPTTVVFDKDQLSLAANSLLRGLPETSINSLDSQSYEAKSKILTLYFSGTESGNPIIYSVDINIDGINFAEKDFSKKVLNCIQEQSPMCKKFRGMDHLLQYGEKAQEAYESAKKQTLHLVSSMDNTSVEFSIDNIKMEISIESIGRGLVTINYKALLMDGNAFTPLGIGSLTGYTNNIDEEKAYIAVLNDFMSKYGTQASAQMIEDEEM